MEKVGDENMAHEKGKRRTVAIIAAAVAVAAIALAALVVAGPWGAGTGTATPGGEGQSQAQQASAPSGTAAGAVERSDGDGSPLLSSWEDFDVYWREAGEGEDATYTETGADGSTRRYRIRDGYVAGTTPAADQPLMQGAEQVGPDGDWDVVVVDCSTGSPSWWKLDPAFAEELGSSGGSAVEGIGLAKFGRGWSGWFNGPVPEGGQKVDDLMGHLTPEETRKYYDDLVDSFEDKDESQRTILVVGMNGNGKFIQRLERRYGDDKIESYLVNGFAEFPEEERRKTVVANRKDRSLIRKLERRYGKDTIQGYLDSAGGDGN
ncbi:MAG: hypothetical protein ACOX69_10615 [Coriobacteriales bacterium]|jgi:hypothetical protein